MIEGIQTIPLKQMIDDRGKVMHMLRSTDPHFQKFGEVYFSQIHPGVVKAWKQNLGITMNFAVPVGCVKIVVYDARPDSVTKGQLAEYFMGPDNYQLLIIPPKLWYGLKGIGNVSSMVVNCATGPHDPVKVLHATPSEGLIPYLWDAT